MKITKYNYGEESNLNLKLVIAIHRSLQTDERNLSSRLAQYGLTLPQFGVLESLYHRGPMNINSVIEKTLSTSGNMTVIIRNLVKAGYITKSRDPEDGRAYIIEISNTGYDIIHELFPKHVEDLRKELSKLDLDEKELLLQLLKKLNNYQG